MLFDLHTDFSGQVFWHCHLWKIHRVKGFGKVNKTEVDVFPELSSFFDDPVDASNLISGSSAFPKTSLNIWKFMVHVADCGSDHELLIAKFRLKLKKVGKTTRPFRYDLNQIPYDYTVEVRNRFKGLDLIDRVPDELWMEVRETVQETRIKTIPKKKKCKKAKWLSEEALQIAEKRSEKQRRKERYKHLNAEFQRIARRDKKAFLSNQCKEIDENNRMGKTRDLLKKIEIPREHFMQRWAQ